MTGRNKDATADRRLWKKIGDEIETEFIRTMADHDSIGIATAENIVSDLQFVVNFLRR